MKTKKTYIEHAKEDSKLIWVVILVAGYLTGGVTDLVEVFKGPLDAIFVSEEEFEEHYNDINSRLNNIEGRTNNDAIIPVNPESGQVRPRVVPRNSA